ncbi:Hsp70 family protein [Nocardia terpenica]|uniref:Hsp70 family protein n=1 Tax=Nocardia terpenica TaxID=455432 RepID=UPI0018939499|nr:Hsp70 family protein [Nocardia terpenica]MBF6061939.1 Hsp70 family protein [Nocardia terpenica]MBF6106260.1 Hsp70 family protein [Nocardia terpenica]MBF6110359.1 Hsp70 family protein [Nocardia terpenica]MBF6120804.1 Hsp70 family protein [Nocardia terpenica]MBF6151695.1 Hsp70 family protein [Nocardia terpenica]
MVLVLGVSAGAGGARAMLTHSDQPHLPPIDRCTVARRVGAGVEEAVFEAIDLMRRSADRRDEFITGIAVTCRCALHADAIRAEAGRSRLTIVDEPLAQLRYLRFSGQLPDEGAVLLYDLGAAGLTLTEADCRTDAILAARYSTVLGGDAHDTLLRWHLAHGGVTIDKTTSRTYKEALSATPVLAVGDPATGTRMVVTRSDFGELVAAGIHHSVSYVRQLLEETGVAPQGLALLGGCTRNPGIRDALAQLLDLPVIYDPEPEFVSARGAVLMATQLPSARRVRGVRFSAMPALRPPKATPVSRRKLVAALAVTATLGATVVGLLAADHEPTRPATHGNTAPTPMEIARTPPNPLTPK